MVKARLRDGGRAFLVSSSIVAGLGKLSATGRQGVGDRAAGWRYRPICGSGSGGIYPDYDSQTQIRGISAVLAQEGRLHRQAAESRDIFEPREGEAARARSPVLQEAVRGRRSVKCAAGSLRLSAALQPAAARYGPADRSSDAGLKSRYSAGCSVCIERLLGQSRGLLHREGNRTCSHRGARRACYRHGVGSRCRAGITGSSPTPASCSTGATATEHATREEC